MTDRPVGVCEVCGRHEQELHCSTLMRTVGDRRSPTVCFDCFLEWYDGGITSGDEIKRRVLAKCVVVEDW